MADVSLASVGENDDDEKVDGRRARRERNRNAVLDAVLEMFSEELLVPTIEKAAERSGMSLRSVYRYFPDPEALTQAAIERNMAKLVPLARLHAIGEGPFDRRLDDFVEMRVRLFERAAPAFRAGVHHEPTIATVRANLHETRRLLSEQFAAHFAPELDALAPTDRARVEVVADLVSQFDSIDVLRRYRRLTVSETADVIASSLRTLLVGSG